MRASHRFALSLQDCARFGNPAQYDFRGLLFFFPIDIQPDKPHMPFIAGALSE
jgi:hypothetical protein